MTVYYLSSVMGDDSTADGSQLLPYATLGAVPYTSGDIIYVDSQHQSNEQLDGVSATAGPPVHLVSIDWSTGAAQYGAGFIKSAGFVIRGGWRVYGVRLGQSSYGYWFDIGVNLDSDIELRGCMLSQVSGAAIKASVSTSSARYFNRIRLIDTNVNPGSQIRIVGGALLEVVGGGVISDTGSDGLFSAEDGVLLVDGFDISAMTSGALLRALGACTVTIRNVPLPSGVSLLSSLGVAAGFLRGGQLYFLGGGTMDIVSRGGYASSTGSVYRIGGALTDGQPMSCAVTPTAYASPLAVSAEIPVAKTMLDLQTDRTIRVYFAQPAGAAPLTNYTAWLSCVYRQPSSGLGRLVESRPASVGGGEVAWPIDGDSSWHGITAPYLQYADIVIPADVSGDAYAQIAIHVAAPGASVVYVDPQPDIL